MTREEAIKVIENRDSIMDYCESAQLSEALDMAIKALSAEPCKDAISREQAIKQCGFGMTSLLIADCLRRLPSVTPKPKAESEEE